MASDEWRCPKCGARVVGEHRDEDYNVLDIHTACGSFYKAPDHPDVQSSTYPAGWTHPNAHTCRMRLGLVAERAAARVERDELKLVVTQVNETNVRLSTKLDRAKRMLVAAGVSEALVEASLEEH